MRLHPWVWLAAVSAALAAGMLGYATLRWSRQDARADAREQIRRELEAERPGHRPVLTARLYGADRRSRAVCVYEDDGRGRMVDVYMLQYRFGVPAPKLLEQYTPRWRRNGAIARDLCMHFAAEPSRSA